jgi:hypothetical protein
VEICRSYAPSDRSYDGEPEAATLLGVTAAQRPGKAIVSYRYEQAAWSAATVRSGPWKLHVTRTNSDPGNSVTAAPPLLYQVEEDPSERIRRENDAPALVDELNGLLAQRRDDVANDQLPAARPPLSGPPVITATEGGTVSLTFIRPAESRDDFYFLERSTDLNAWDPVPISDLIEERRIEENEMEQVLLRLTTEFFPTDASAAFVRLKFLPKP